jgi:hypothetical protein
MIFVLNKVGKMNKLDAYQCLHVTGFRKLRRCQPTNFLQSCHISTGFTICLKDLGLHSHQRSHWRLDLMEAKILKAATTVLLEIFFYFSHQDKPLTKWVVKQPWAQLNLLLEFQLIYVCLKWHFFVCLIHKTCSCEHVYVCMYM